MMPMWIFLAACGPAGTVDKPVSTTTTTTTTPSTTTTTTTNATTTPLGATLTAACVPLPNALRMDCTVHVEPAMPVALRFSPMDGGPERVQISAEVSTDHQITAVLMAPETEYTWTIASDSGSPSVTGTWTTGALPFGVQVEFTVEGVSSTDFVLMQSPCLIGAYALVASTEGQLLWYHDLTVVGGPSPFVEGVTWTEDNTLLAVVNDDIVEVTLEGTEVMVLRNGLDYVGRLHHDVVRRNGYTYVLFVETVAWLDELWEFDGFFVFDSLGGLVKEWHLFDYITPMGDPFGTPGRDYSHANSLWLDTDGTLLMSMRHLSAVARIVSDPVDANFGDIDWRLSGEPGVPDFGSDFLISSPVTSDANFSRQHHATERADGRMLLFDNRRSFLELSRVLSLEIDTVTGQAVIDEVYPLPVHCDFQGGVFETAAGDLLSTCAPLGKGFEFSVATGAQTWSMETSCSTGMNTYIPRFIPFIPPE